MSLRLMQKTDRLRIVLAGGGGRLGQALAQRLQQSGHFVSVLTRSPFAAPWRTIYWDGENGGLWMDALKNADVCINLAGHTLHCRYTDENREKIRHSRLHTTRLLGEVIAECSHPPRLWINASTVDIYRHSMDTEMDEETGELGGWEKISRFRRAPAKWRFAATLAFDGEELFFAAATPQTRKIALRLGQVMLAAPGGAFARLSHWARAGLGGTLGSGRQYVSWIHGEDFLRAVEFLLWREELAGAINVTAPNPLPNREFMAALREAWDRPNGLPAPWPLIELAALLMRTETEIVLKSRRATPRRLLEAGFEFLYPEWPEAAEDLVRRWKSRDVD